MALGVRRPRATRRAPPRAPAAGAGAAARRAHRPPVPHDPACAQPPAHTRDTTIRLPRVSAGSLRLMTRTCTLLQIVGGQQERIGEGDAKVAKKYSDRFPFHKMLTEFG